MVPWQSIGTSQSAWMASTSAWLLPQQLARAGEALSNVWALIQSLVFEVVVVPDFSQMNVFRASQFLPHMYGPYS